MRVIIDILHVEQRTDKAGKSYYRTHALVDSGEECVGYGKDFKVGDLVEVFFDHKYNTIKMRRGKHDSGPRI